MKALTILFAGLLISMTSATFYSSHNLTQCMQSMTEIVRVIEQYSKLDLNKTNTKSIQNIFSIVNILRNDMMPNCGSQYMAGVLNFWLPQNCSTNLENVISNYQQARINYKNGASFYNQFSFILNNSQEIPKNCPIISSIKNMISPPPEIPVSNSTNDTNTNPNPETNSTTPNNSTNLPTNQTDSTNNSTNLPANETNSTNSTDSTPSNTTDPVGPVLTGVKFASSLISKWLQRNQ